MSLSHVLARATRRELNRGTSAVRNRSTKTIRKVSARPRSADLARVRPRRPIARIGRLNAILTTSPHGSPRKRETEACRSIRLRLKRIGIPPIDLRSRFMRKRTKSRQNATRRSRTAPGFTFSRKFPTDACAGEHRTISGFQFHPVLRFARGMRRFARQRMSGARVRGSSVTSGRVCLNMKVKVARCTDHAGVGDGRPSTLDLRKPA